MATDYIKMVNGFLQKMGNLGPLGPDGTCVLRRGSAVILVGVLPQQNLLVISSPIMDLPAKNRLALYRKLLELNNAATLDTFFAIEDDNFNQVFVMLRRSLQGLDYNEFQRALGMVGAVADSFDDQLRAEFR